MSDQRDETSTPSAPLPSREKKSRSILSRYMPAFVVLVMVASVVVFFVLRNNPFDRALGTYAIAGGAFLSVISLLAWFGFVSPFSVKLRVAGILLAVVVMGSTFAMVRIEGFHGAMRPELQWRWARRSGEIVSEFEFASNASLGIDLTTTTPDDFPQFLGPNRNQNLPGPSLERDWIRHPPQLVWSHEIGGGWSPFIARNGYAVTLEQVGGEERITCYEIATGRLCWSNGIQAKHTTRLGGLGPRSAPTLDEGRVYTQGATGMLRCNDGATGEELWRHDLLAEQGLTPEEDLVGIAWGRAGSPLIVGDLVVIPVGGPAEGPFVSLAAFDKISGKLVWEGGEKQIGYSSPTLAQLGGRQQILLVGESEVAGFDPANGNKLWAFDQEGTSKGDVNASQAVVIGDDLVFGSKGYGTGATLAQVRPAPDGWSVDILWDRFSNSRAVMRTKLTNVVIVDRFVYGLDDTILQCIQLDTGQQMWRGQRRRTGDYGHGQILRVGDLLLVLTETGELVMVDLNPEKLIELGRITVLEGKTWNNLCLYGQYLLVRNSLYAACYKLPVQE